MHCFVNVEMTYFDIVHMMLDYDCMMRWLVVLDRMHRFDVADMMQDFLVIVGMMHCFVNANMNGYGKMYTGLF